MPAIFLDDSKCRAGLVPFSLTMHVADFRVGILTIREKWEKITGKKIITSAALVEHDTVVVNANIIPSQHNAALILQAAKDDTPIIENQDLKILQHPWQIFQWNDKFIREDFELLTAKRKSVPISSSNSVISPENVFVEDGAILECCTINASTGPVYIGANALVMEGSLIRGPLALCEKAVLKMGCKVYGATTLGPYCVGGGEIKNVVMFGYSNKAHEGYLGDSVIGEWCNIGAGTSSSNVKNNGGVVKYFLNDDVDFATAGNKAGLLMGSYSRAAINTAFNTGTVVGVCCNIFGNILHKKHISNFSWGEDKYSFDKALRDIANWKRMKGFELTTQEKILLEELYKNNQ